MKLVLTEAALSDLRSIRSYTLESWGKSHESIYLEKLWSKFEMIQKDPNRYGLRPDLFPGCRIAGEGKHLVLFRVNDNALEIVRVLHSSMDIRRHLP